MKYQKSQKKTKNIQESELTNCSNKICDCSYNKFRQNNISEFEMIYKKRKRYKKPEKEDNKGENSLILDPMKLIESRADEHTKQYLQQFFEFNKEKNKYFSKLNYQEQALNNSSQKESDIIKIGKFIKPSNKNGQYKITFVNSFEEYLQQQINVQKRSFYRSSSNNILTNDDLLLTYRTAYIKNFIKQDCPDIDNLLQHLKIPLVAVNFMFKIIKITTFTDSTNKYKYFVICINKYFGDHEIDKVEFFIIQLDLKKNCVQLANIVPPGVSTSEYLETYIVELSNRDIKVALICTHFLTEFQISQCENGQMTLNFFMKKSLPRIQDCCQFFDKYTLVFSLLNQSNLVIYNVATETQEFYSLRDRMKVKFMIVSIINQIIIIYTESQKLIILNQKLDMINSTVFTGIDRLIMLGDHISKITFVIFRSDQLIFTQLVKRQDIWHWIQLDMGNSQDKSLQQTNINEYQTELFQVAQMNKQYLINCSLNNSKQQELMLWDPKTLTIFRTNFQKNKNNNINLTHLSMIETDGLIVQTTFQAKCLMYFLSIDKINLLYQVLTGPAFKQ